MKCPVDPVGKVHAGDAINLLKCLPSKSIDLVVTSPPYAEKRKKQYGGIPSNDYSAWFAPIAKELNRVLKDDGSFVLNIKEHVDDGERSDYVHDTIKKIRDQGFRWTETYIWEKTNPYPIKPVNRFKDGFEYIHHFTKSPGFKFFPDAVKIPAKTGCDLYHREHERSRGGDRVSKMNGYRNYSDAFLESCKNGMAYPSNIIMSSVNSRSGIDHPATFPEKVPEFFINLLSRPGDIVLDPFAGSGTTNRVAKRLCRNTIGFDLNEKYATNANESLQRVTCTRT